MNVDIPQLQSAAADVRAAIGQPNWTPRVGIVCGSGLSKLGDILENPTIVNYSKITGLRETQSTVHGHKSSLALGTLGGVNVVCQLGRLHGYEGHSLDKVTFVVRLMHQLGVEIVILTNAAGSLNPSYNVGSIVSIRDHIGLPALNGVNPLIGRNDDSYGPRFLAMSDAYDFDLRKKAFKALSLLKLSNMEMVEGSYIYVTGPTYETRAEQRFMHKMGGDVVGMSTVPEVIAARHCGMRVCAFSLVTNMVTATPIRSAHQAFLDEEAGLVDDHSPDDAVSHDEVIHISNQKSDSLCALIRTLVSLV